VIPVAAPSRGASAPGAAVPVLGDAAATLCGAGVRGDGAPFWVVQEATARVDRSSTADPAARSRPDGIRELCLRG
jgi:hypothetical protein